MSVQNARDNEKSVYSVIIVMRKLLAAHKWITEDLQVFFIVLIFFFFIL